MENINKKPLIVITGPTAVGKTDLSIRLAKDINGEIISADSIQIYKYMDIGSAKVMPEEMNGVVHHLIDELYPDEEFNVYTFKKMANKAMDGIYKRGSVPVIAGGTGFYIQSVLYDISFDEEQGDKEYRHYLEELALKKGNEFIHNMLKAVDEEAANVIHMNNTKRVIRALEYYNETGKKFSQNNEEQRQNESPYEFKYFVLNMDREKLYERINMRVDMMVKAGLIEEVENLLKMGYHRELNSMQGIGYKEIVSYLNGEMSYNEAIETLKQNTRHFAKRQLTWFRREKTVTWVNYEDFDNNKEKVYQYILEETKKCL